MSKKLRSCEFQSRKNLSLIQKTVHREQKVRLVANEVKLLPLNRSAFHFEIMLLQQKLFISDFNSTKNLFSCVIFIVELLYKLCRCEEFYKRCTDCVTFSSVSAEKRYWNHCSLITSSDQTHLEKRLNSYLSLHRFSHSSLFTICVIIHTMVFNRRFPFEPWGANSQQVGE